MKTKSLNSTITGLDTGCGLETVTLETLAVRRGWRGRFRMGKSASNPQPISNPQPVSKPVIASAANHSVVKRTRYRQYFSFSRNICQVTLRILYFHYVKKIKLDQTIHKMFYLIMKTEALDIVLDTGDGASPYQQLM